MRNKSAKTRAREKQAKPVRQALLAEIHYCEKCGHRKRPPHYGYITWNLGVHEIARGCHRQKALDQRYAVLVLCWRCNEEMPSGIRSEIEQLRLLRASRPDDYNLRAYNALIGRGKDRITQQEVDAIKSTTEADSA